MKARISYEKIYISLAFMEDDDDGEGGLESLSLFHMHDVDMGLRS